MSEGVLVGRDPRNEAPIAVRYAGGRITAIEPGPSDAAGYLAPGLVDLQVNGYAGHDLNSGALDAETVTALTAALRRIGVTTFLPTLITAPDAALERALAAIAAARRADPAVAHAIPFVHLEGPWIAPEDGPRGAHPRDFVRAPDLDSYERWQRAGDGLIGLITLSPHYPETPDVVRALVVRGVRVAIGHTGAAPEAITAAVDAGATLSTHLGNGVAAVLPRHPNLLWTQLADDRLHAGFIADGHHLSAEVFKAMLRAKGLGRAVLVSDATALGGLAPGAYEQPIGGRVELSADGRLSLAGTPYLAGAALSLGEGVARATRLGDIGLADALVMATGNPGDIVGGRGRLEIGADADLIRFRWRPGDDALGIDTVLVRGQGL